MAESSNKFHPALAVSNIKKSVPIRLESEKGQYDSWAELFKIHFRAYNVYEHIIPSKTLTEREKEPDFNKDLWNRLDAIVLTWIYGTIAPELLITILKKNSTAKDQWDQIENFFLDNKNVRASALETKFTNTFLDDFPDVSSHCQELKNLADQLANVDTPDSNHRLVLRLINGLNENFDTVASTISPMDPLPEFYAARSRLLLEETRKSRQAEVATRSPSQQALVAQQGNETARPPQNSGSGNNSNRNQQNRGHTNSSNRNQSSNREKGKGRGRGGSIHGGGSYNGGGRHQPPPPWNQQNPYQSYLAILPWAGQWGSSWNAPPCPYPTGSWSRPPPPLSRQSDVLRSRPQAYNTQFQRMELEQAFQTMTLNPPDSNWYMDTGATSHMTGEGGHPEWEDNNEV